MKPRIGLLLAILLAVSCGGEPDGKDELDRAAERFVRLGLEFGELDPDYVDAYLGPTEWREAAKENARPPEQLETAIARLLADVVAISPSTAAARTRQRALERNVRAMATRMRIVRGEQLSFAEEARLIYDVVLPVYDFSEFDRILDELEHVFPGDGDLATRVDTFLNSLTIPDEQRDVVVDHALNECKRRTARYIALPPDEGFDLEYVTGKAWTGYNWYQGNNRSLMQLNLDFPLKAGRIVELGCHEGYPGHHVWNVLVENRLLGDNGWIEYSIFPLFSPAALIAEGSAEYGVSLAFPGKERETYEREVLFPLARLDAEKVTTLGKYRSLTTRLDHARAATAQLYLDGRISREDAIEQRRKYGLSSRARAEQSVRFIEQYRSYVLNYNLGQDVVRVYIESQGDDLETRWKAFVAMLTDLPAASDMMN